MSVQAGSTSGAPTMSAYSALDDFVNSPSSEQSPSETDEADVAQVESGDAEASEEVETAEGQEAEGEEEEAAKEPEEDIYEFQGNEKAIRFNLNDKEKIKKILPMAYGFREATARANRAEDKLKNLEPKYQDVQGKLDYLNKVYEEKGLEGVIDMLGQKEGYHKEWLQSRYEQMREYEDASPSERERLDALQRAEAAERRLAAREAAIKAEEERLQLSKEESDLKSLETELAPVFNRFRFQGKLGDKDAEAFYDKALWNQTIEALEGLDESELTDARIEMEFQKNYKRASSVIKQKADEKAKRTVETKKNQARAGAKIAAKKGTAPTSQEKQMEHIKSGNWTDAILASLGVR